MSTALIWFRRDLRLHDNPALSQALAVHEQLIPVYIHAPQEEPTWEPGAASRWWLHHSLAALDKSLRERGTRLLVLQGESLPILRDLIKKTKAQAVYWNRLYEPAMVVRDKTIKAALREDGIKAESFNGALLYEPCTIKTQAGDPYKVFTPFWKACVQHAVPAPPWEAPAQFKPPKSWPRSLPLDALNLLPRIDWYRGIAETWRPGEAAALDRLEYFLQSILQDYPKTHDLPGTDGVSRLSPHLHFGELSPRQIWMAVTHWAQGNPLENKAAQAYLRQLGWRDFAHEVLYHWPHTPEQPMREKFADYPWRRNYTDLLEAWQQGRTGYPIIDAGMRQLWQTGWMHNRLRMLVASLLTKNCRIHWQEGARWFWDTLVDADLANNTLGWQWVAGCGTDAAPYFRIFNPVRQSEKFDPEAQYIRRWVPEVARLPNRWIHQPWAAPENELHAAGITLGDSYPYPMVDLSSSREEALKGYERIKGN